MTGYIGSTPVPQGIKETQSFTATAGQTTFNTLGYSDGNNISVFLNGVRLINGTDYTATNGSDIVLTAAASASDVLDFETFNEFNLVNQNLTTPTFTDSASVTSTTTASVSVSGDTTATLSLKNNTHEDTDGGRESTVIFQGEQSGGEISTLAEIEASHDGTSDDEKGDLIFRTNDGSDGASPTERLRIDSAGKVGIGAASSFSTLEVTADKTASNNLQLTLRGSTDTNKQMIMGFDTTDDQSIITSQIAGSAQKPLVINASAVTIPNQPSFAAGISHNNWTTSSNADAPFDTEIFDIGNNYNTSNYTFTAPVAGRYFASLSFNRYTDSRFDIAFVVNGTPRQAAELRTSHSSDNWKIEDFQTILNLAANDAVKMRITGVDSQGSGFFDGNGTFYDVFSMHLLG